MDAKPAEEEKTDYSKVDIDLVNEQYAKIQKEIEENSPIISDILPLTLLEDEFSNNPPFLEKIRAIQETHKNYRKIRRDGSCFYRALLFSIMEHIIVQKDTALLSTFEKLMKNSKEDLKKVGFEEFVIDDFQQLMLEKINFLEEGVIHREDLVKMFCDKETSDSLILYLRFLTSGYIKANAALYETFIEDIQGIDHFCQVEVEPIDREADQIQITALINYINIPIMIVYLDSNTGMKKPQTMIIPEGTDEKLIYVKLIYRPGHYDILYE